jgi:hypothetical protein
VLTCDIDKGIDGKNRGVPPTSRTFVTPRGEFIAGLACEYGLIGNRGVLHDDQGEIVMRFASKAWIACSRSCNADDPKRPATAPGRYTLLRFLDEATAFAAGHRPCWTCRRTDFLRFLSAWAKGNPGYGLNADTSITDVDAVIHRQRIGANDQKLTFTASLGALPDGCIVQVADADCLVFGAHLHRWSPAGYTGKIARPPGLRVLVLTPRSVVSALSAGYMPRAHPSATL